MDLGEGLGENEITSTLAFYGQGGQKFRRFKESLYISFCPGDGSRTPDIEKGLQVLTPRANTTQ